MRIGRKRSAAYEIEPTGLRGSDAASEAVSAMVARPGRAALTVLGTLLGVAAFVAVLGLTATASGQISQRFTALTATEVTVEDSPAQPEIADYAYPEDAEERIGRLNGVRHVGLYWQAKTGDVAMSARPPGVSTEPAESLPVIAASPGYLDAIHPELQAGRLYDAFHNARALRVCVLGKAAAARLGVSRLDTQPAIFVGGTALTVVGIVDDVDRHPETLLSILVPSKTASLLWGEPAPRSGQSAKMLIETRLGAAQLIASQAAVGLRPEQPERFKVTAPPDPRELRDQVGDDLNALFLALAGICLVIGAVGIANTTLVAVMERTPEIGLRRSLGACRQHIAAQFLTESAALGLVGGLIGTSIGVAVVVGVALVQRWTPILEPLTVLPSPLIGALTGVVAGLYPAWRASLIEPVEALRR